jgi:hypothetical protein
MFKNYYFILVSFSMIAFCGCHQEKESQQMALNTQKVTGPHIIIYKTKSDYFDKIPIGMSANKKTIISYPAKTDIYTNGLLALPTKLEGGYLLDNRGISADAAFIKLSYEEYAGLSSTPTMEELKEMIIDLDPVSTMYDCGVKSKYHNLIEDINKLILKNDFSEFKKLK